MSPGLYCDEGGSLHIHIPELLAMCGYAPTPNNVETIGRVAREVAAEIYPGMPVEDYDAEGKTQ